MDQILVDYLKSNRAWLLVGSGPSIAMGYPSWARLAEAAVKVAMQEIGSKDDRLLNRMMEAKDYPAVFDKVKTLLGSPRLLQVLRSGLKANSHGEVYDLIARWPVSVYLTTNYDNEISSHLVRLGESYQTYSNSEDHLALMNTDLNGAIVKLHGERVRRRKNDLGSRCISTAKRFPHDLANFQVEVLDGFSQADRWEITRQSFQSSLAQRTIFKGLLASRAWGRSH